MHSKYFGFNANFGFGHVLAEACNNPVPEGVLPKGMNQDFQEGDKVYYEYDGYKNIVGEIEDANLDENGCLNVSGVGVPLNKIRKFKI